MNQPASHHENHTGIDMPRPTAAPLVMASGIALTALGIATSAFVIIPGLVIFVAGLSRWIEQLLPGRGHEFEPRVSAELLPKTVIPATGAVERLQHGAPGYRLRLPLQVHPVSAGIKGGLVGGLIMPIPALAYGILSGHGLWWPVNLLAGMAVPGVGAMTNAELSQFHPMLLMLAILVHVSISLVSGLTYGVLMPMLPDLPKPLAWGALLMPLLWTAVSYAALGLVNPGIRESIAWSWFMLSQFVFGLTAASVFLLFKQRGPIIAGLTGGVIGGILMPAPALLWSLTTGHGLWYPANLLSMMILRHGDDPGLTQLEAFHPNWLAAAIGVHAVLTISFGLAFAFVLPHIPKIPGPIAWGGFLLPVLWTALSYSLMGVVNPALQDRVSWPWFVVSQFVFGIVAAIIVDQSEKIAVRPAGPAADHLPKTPV